MGETGDSAGSRGNRADNLEERHFGDFDLSPWKRVDHSGRVMMQIVSIDYPDVLPIK